jgi:hypothetical protein
MMLVYVYRPAVVILIFFLQFTLNLQVICEESFPLVLALLFDNHFDLFNSLVNALNPNPTKSWFSI